MGMVVPNVRKHLCADALLRSVQDIFGQVPDHRKGDPEITLSDALMSAFAMFSLKALSLLAFDKERTEDNLQRVYGIGRVPCDTSMRAILDPVEPEHLRPAFKGAFRQLQRGKALEEMVFVQGHYLLALDGTGYFSSNEIHCESCLEKHHRHGTVTYSHQMLGAALIHPDKREVIPLMPEPIVKQDGSEKNDCERNAAKRFVTKFRRDHPHLKVIVTEDSLSSNAPHIEKHNFGHGYQHLSVVFAVLMMLAFLVDQVQQLCCPLFQAAWAKWGSKRLLWEMMRAYFYAYALQSMR